MMTPCGAGGVVGGAPLNDPYSAYQAAMGAAPYGGPQPTACAQACASALDRGGALAQPVSPPTAAGAAVDHRAEARRAARKPHTPTKKHMDPASSSYQAAYALPASGLKPRSLY